LSYVQTNAFEALVVKF